MGAEAPGLCAAPGGGGIPRSEDQGTRPIRSSPMKRPTFALKIHPAKLEIERRFDRIPPSTGFQPRLEGPTLVRSREPTRRDRRDDTLAIGPAIGSRYRRVARSLASILARTVRRKSNPRCRSGARQTSLFAFFQPRGYPTLTPSILTCADRSAATTPHPTLAGGILQRADAGGATAGGGAHHGRETQARRPRPARRARSAQPRPDAAVARNVRRVRRDDADQAGGRRRDGW